MATPADLIAAAGAAGAAPRRPVARPAVGISGTAPGGVETLDAGGPASGHGVTQPMLDLTRTVMPPDTLGGLPGFKPMGGMPAPPPQMAQGREVVEQDGQQGVVGAGGNFQPLGQAALSRLPGGPGGGGPFGGSGGIIADEARPDIRPMPPSGMPGFRAMPPSPYQRQGGGRTDAGGGKLRAMVEDGRPPTASGAISNSGEIQGDGARGMSSIGAAVGRAMRPRPVRSAVSREGAAPGY